MKTAFFKITKLKTKGLRIIISVIFLSLSPCSLKSQDISRFIDSIETLNLYAHDTVKIKNYISLYEKLDGNSFDTSLFYINKCLVLDSIYKSKTFTLYKIKGLLLHSLKKFFSALENYDLALSNSKTIKDKIEINYLKGLLYLDINYYEEGYKCLTFGLKLCEEINEKDLQSKILNSIGYFYELREEYSKALPYFLRSLNIYQELNDYYGISTSFNNIGVVFFYLKQYDSALVYYKNALEINIKYSSKFDQAIPLFNIGETYYEKGELQKAINYIVKSYEIEKEFNGKEGMAIALNFLGKIYAELGTYQYSLALLEQSLKICLEIKNQNELKEVYLNISNIYEKLKNTEKALLYYKLYNDVKDSLFDIDANNKILELEAKYLTEQKDQEIKIQKSELENKEIQISQQFNQQIFISAGFLFLLVFSVIMYRNYRLKNKSNALLIDQKVQIEQQNKKITSSIQYAKLIQTAALPPHDLMKSVFSQHFVLFLPRDIVSGDFFWATHKDGYAVVACADCTGHGVPGAFMSMLGVSFLTEIVNRSATLDTCNILENLRQNIIDSLHQTGKIGESRDGMDIALCIINQDRTELEYAGAFIPLVVIRDNNIIQIAGDKMPIGVHDDTLQPFTSHKVRLLKDDMIYMFSDGYADQFGGPFNKKFKVQPFLSLLLAQHTKSLVQQREILYDTMMTWRGDQEQVDDILVMGFRV